MSTPRPTEDDVEALAPIEECIDPADLMEAMVHAGAWAAIEATTDTADREPSRELYEQTVADVRPWLAAEHQREVEALREVLRIGVELDNHHNADACPYCTGGIRARAEAAEADRDEARRELADLRAKVAGLHGGTHWCFDADEGDVVFEPDTQWWPCPTYALLPTEDDQ